MSKNQSPVPPPRNLLDFLYWVFFKPFSLRAYVKQVAPETGSAFALLNQSRPSARLLKRFALFYTLLVPYILCIGFGLILSYSGVQVNWLKLGLYMFIAVIMSLSFSLGFCVAFLIPCSLGMPLASANLFGPAAGVIFSLMLGLAYGLNPNRATWGLAAGILYGVVFVILASPLGGLAVGAAFLVGYFRVFLYVIEAPLAWALSRFAARGDALKLWRLNPAFWDEVVWFQLPGLNQHLLSLKEQNEPASREAILHVKSSFRQGRAAENL